MISEDEKSRLIQAAREVRRNAYVPYSNFRVGAALLTSDGSIITGVNVENASYGLTICAERTAVTRMVTLGKQVITAIAVSSDNGVTPCGACRQVLSEFAADVPVWIINDETGDVRETTMHTLLPDFFSQEQLVEN